MNKGFLGNLQYDAIEGSAYALFAKHWNILLHSVGLEAGWSKGCDFMQFYKTNGRHERHGEVRVKD